MTGPDVNTKPSAAAITEPVAACSVVCGSIRSAAVAALIAAAVVATLVWPWILAKQDRFSEKSYDHDRFHLPLVRTFAEEWPAVDLSDYPSATGPGFHLALATLAQAFGAAETTLQFLGSLFAIGLAATVAWRFARWRGSAW